MADTSIAARANQLIEIWGRSRALEMASRYLGEADAFMTSAEYQMEQAPSGDENEDLRRRSHVEHLVEDRQAGGTGGGRHQWGDRGRRPAPAGSVTRAGW